ncbi:GTP-binding family protein [Hibiscus syriacus]|uniref:acyl-CoA oxidase n=1 Tax=Hibiscus syriacus TaxID=106335 RepID=A0A6A3C860_HIBSY|nr:GTP-binding family protein [Hibiscus syriacus]
MLYRKRTTESNKTVHVVSSSFKATFTWNNMQILQVCREACGGQGLKTENRVGHLKAEFDVQSTFEGDNTILMQQVSKVLLAEYIAVCKRNEGFTALGLGHMNKPRPVIPSQLTSTTLRCSEFQMDALCLRERDLLDRFGSDVSKCRAKGASSEQAFNMCYQLGEDLSKAFSERAIFQIFVEAEATLPPGSLKDVLGTLRSLYALTCTEDASYLRYGYLSVENGANVRREIAKLCSELRPHALALVTSFGIPDAFLSPLAFNWIDANSVFGRGVTNGTGMPLEFTKLTIFLAIKHTYGELSEKSVSRTQEFLDSGFLFRRQPCRKFDVEFDYQVSSFRRVFDIPSIGTTSS